jgi:hypothetical protein
MLATKLTRSTRANTIHAPRARVNQSLEIRPVDRGKALGKAFVSGGDIILLLLRRLAVAVTDQRYFVHAV